MVSLEVLGREIAVVEDSHPDDDLGDDESEDEEL